MEHSPFSFVTEHHSGSEYEQLNMSNDKLNMSQSN